MEGRERALMGTPKLRGERWRNRGHPKMERGEMEGQERALMGTPKQREERWRDRRES